MAKPVEVVSVETASLHSDVKATIQAACDASRRLAEVSDVAGKSVLEVFASALAPELRGRSTALRASAGHALALAAELYALAGRLEQVASTYEAANW